MELEGNLLFQNLDELEKELSRIQMKQVEMWSTFALSSIGSKII